MTVSMIPLNRITLDPTLTARAERPDLIVRQYAADMQDRHTFPPLTCFSDGTAIFLVDGWLRFLAAKQLGRSHVEATVTTCSRREMRLHAAAANATGRSQEDRRLAVLIVLEEMPNWTVTQVVKHCRVSPSLVSGLVAVRARMPLIKAEQAAEKSARETLVMPVKPATPKAPPPPAPRPAPTPPRPAAPKPPPVTADPWIGVLDARRDDDEPEGEDAVAEEPEPFDDDDGDDEFDEFSGLDAERLEERMMRAGRKFARYIDEFGGLSDAEAMARVRADMKVKAAISARRGRPERPPALPPAGEAE